MMILDSLLALLVGGILVTVDVPVPPGWVLDSVQVTLEYEFEITVEDPVEQGIDVFSNAPVMTSDLDIDNRDFRLITGQPIDSWRLLTQWGADVGRDGVGGIYTFSRRHLGRGWDFLLTVVHESAPFHAQEAKWKFTHGLL